MLKKNINILKVDFDLCKGLILDWNLSGNANSCFFRHILIIDTSKLFDYQTFVNKFFQKIKSGDIICFGFINQDGQNYMHNWKQKTNLAQIQIKKFRPTLSNLHNLIELMQSIQKTTKDMEQPIIYSILTQREQKDIKQLQKYSKKFIQKRQSYFVNIFGDIQSCIQITTGVNVLSLKQFEEEEAWNFLKFFLNQIALLKIKITIQCQNGIIASQKQSQWKTVEFNKIVRQLRAPSVNYQQDLIHFVNQESSDQINYILNIILQYKGLNNQAYAASKKVAIKAMNEKMYQRTFGGRQIQYGVQVIPGIFSRKNPFKSQSLVWFKKNMNQQTT